MRRLIVLLIATLPAFANTFISPAEIGGFFTTIVSASAEVLYGNYSPLDPPSLSTAASAGALTFGPLRNGFIEINGSGGGEFGNGSGSVGSYTFACGQVGCSGILSGAPAPFELGVPFTISVSAFAAEIGMFGGSGDISFQFSLFEVSPINPRLPGAPVIVVYDASSVPEPATFAAVGLGLLGLAKLYLVQRGA
jgi:hypothetical protein